MDPYGAYGASKASGTPFDPITYIRNPQVILRIICIVFAIVVFSTISTQGWYEGKCQYNQNGNVCRLGTGIGIISLLVCALFLYTDGKFENIASIQERKYIVMADFGFSAFWTFIWFVTFCRLSNSWRKTKPSTLPPMSFGRNNVQAAITFALFSAFSWAAVTFLAWRRYKIGADSAFTSNTGLGPSHLVDSNAPAPSSSYFGDQSGTVARGNVNLPFETGLVGGNAPPSFPTGPPPALPPPPPLYSGNSSGTYEHPGATNMRSLY